MEPGSITASDYFRRLANVLLEIEPTNHAGQRLSLDEAGDEAAIRIIEAKLHNRAVYVIGNGGSAAIASHTQNDLLKAVGVRAFAFNDVPLLTALANDHGYESVFERPLAMWVNPGDLLIAISSSGKSPSILRAVAKTKEKGGAVITLSGFTPENPLRTMGDLNFYANGVGYGPVELAHSCLVHFMTDRAVVLGSKANS